MNRHRWSEPERPSSELSIRTCTKCGLQCYSHHDWQKNQHWKEYAEPEGEKTLVMPECRDE